MKMLREMIFDDSSSEEEEEDDDNLEMALMLIVNDYFRSRGEDRNSFVWFKKKYLVH